MKTIYKLKLFVCSLLLVTACEDLDQVPSNIASSDSLSDFTGVLNAAYYYQHATTTPMAVMGDFRADNAEFFEEPYPAFDRFNSDLLDMQDQFFEPFYVGAYRSILSANSVIANSDDAEQVGEAKFLRALSYFKLVRAFGDVTVRLTPGFITDDYEVFERQPAANVYNDVIIADLTDAIAALDNDLLSQGRATQIAAKALLGKVYMQMGNFTNAETYLEEVINDSAAAGVSLQANFTDAFADLNAEIIFSHQISVDIVDEYGFTEFTGWYIGNDSKADKPLDADLVAAFDAVAGEVSDATAGDLRRIATIDEATSRGVKYGSENTEQDWIELRYADIILLYAEALNENGSDAETVLDLLDDIRTRAGLNVLDHTVLNTQALVRQAIADERRLELAFEGHRWFDLVRTGTVDAEMGQTINSDYYLFPLPNTDILASNSAITQNSGY